MQEVSASRNMFSGGVFFHTRYLRDQTYELIVTIWYTAIYQMGYD